MKKFFKFIYQKIPFKRELYSILKLILIPKPSVRKYLRFKSQFRIKVDANRSFYMYQNFYQKESEIFWNGISGYENQSLTIWKILSEDAHVIFDIGANSGIYSLLSKCVNRQAHVYAFEPVPKMLSALKKNDSLNGFEITSISSAVSNKDGTGIIYDLNDIKDSLTASLNKDFSPKNQIPIKTKIVRLDSFMRENKIDSVDLVKIDVETHEPEVLEGFLEGIRKSKPTILIEILNSVVASKVNDLIREFNYLIYRIDENKGIFRTESIEPATSLNYLLIQERVMGKFSNISDKIN
jgi:FkbM family methyltransferase